MKHSILIVFGIALLGAIISASQDGLWPLKEANLLCRKHRAFNLPAGTCDGTCTTVQTQTACQKECMKDKDCVGINISKEFGYEGRCDVCNECDGKVCEGTEGASDASGDSDLQTWPVGGMEYYPINEPGCTCAGQNNEYNEGATCFTYGGYTGDDGEWYNGKWCFASVATCADAAEHEWGGLPGYGASRIACKTQWSEYSNVIRDATNDNKKCAYYGNDRVFTLRNSAATEVKCRAECSKNDKCVAVSGKWNEYCFGCDKELKDQSDGFIAFKKTVSGTISPDVGNDGKKCAYAGTNRVFDLRGTDATETKCRDECKKINSCVAFSGIWNSFCIGCKVALSDNHTGTKAFKKE